MRHIAKSIGAVAAVARGRVWPLSRRLRPTFAPIETFVDWLEVAYGGPIRARPVESNR